MSDIETVRNYVAWRRNPGVTGDTTVTDALARVLAVAEAAVAWDEARKRLARGKSLGAHNDPFDDHRVAVDELTTAVAALRGATETGEGVCVVTTCRNAAGSPLDAEGNRYCMFHEPRRGCSNANE